jgi:hypothetical protein
VQTVESANKDSSSLTIHALNSFLNLVSTVLGANSSGKPILKDCGGSNRTLGNRKRMITVKNPPVAAAKPNQPRASQLKKLLLSIVEGLFLLIDPTAALGASAFVFSLINY